MLVAIKNLLIRFPGAKFAGLVMLIQHSALDSWGWYRSLEGGFPCDAHGNPLPWLSYPATFFLAPRVQPHFRVFEFGSGSSTLWWAARVRSVASCEHDAAWSARLAAQSPANVRLLHTPLGAAYPLTAQSTGESFHVVVVDGRMRAACAASSLDSLTPDGVLVWDDTNRERYRPAIEDLAVRGFKRLDFVGLSPLVLPSKQTTIFYRPENCLGL